MQHGHSVCGMGFLIVVNAVCVGSLCYGISSASSATGSSGILGICVQPVSRGGDLIISDHHLWILVVRIRRCTCVYACVHVHAYIPYIRYIRYIQWYTYVCTCAYGHPRIGHTDPRMSICACACAHTHPRIGHTDPRMRMCIHGIYRIYGIYGIYAIYRIYGIYAIYRIYGIRCVYGICISVHAYAHVRMHILGSAMPIRGCASAHAHTHAYIGAPAYTVYTVYTVYTLYSHIRLYSRIYRIYRIRDSTTGREGVGGGGQDDVSHIRARAHAPAI